MVPFTVFIIFFLLYLNFKSVTESLIVMLSVPFSPRRRYMAFVSFRI